MAKFNKGLHVCKITGQGFDVSLKKGTPFFFLTFVVTGRVVENNEVVSVSAGDQQEIRMYLSERAVPFAIENLRSLGWEGSKFSELEPGGVHSFVAQEIDLRNEHEVNGDFMNDKWEFPREPRKVSENKAGLTKGLDALFGRELKKTSSKAPPKSEEAESSPTSPPDDDIPF